MPTTGPANRAGISRSSAALAALLITTTAHATEAWVSAERANVRLLPSSTSPIIGRLERGDQVEVADGVDAPQGWTLLRPLGAVRTRLVSPEGPSDEQPGFYVYGRVITPSADVRAQPSPDAQIVDRKTRRQILAFKSTVDLSGPWLERPDGTFIARAEVKLLVGSAFRGVLDPPPVLAFLLRTVRVRPTGDRTGPETVLERYSAVAVLSVGRAVRSADGDLPRDAVRLARAIVRPAGIGPEERWVHVNTTEQVLTAYEGDRLVFATLISTGKRDWETPTGHFQVWLKLRHGEMRGHRVRYLVEEVPNSLFFGGATALHGVIWHDRFGWAVSHGCVNLSPADAEWLFQWAPPALPDRWHGILPGPAGLETLWVIVEK